MAKRGRPLKDEASRKSEPVSIRLTQELRSRLEAERMSADPERTLSQEIDQRIRESFDLDKSIKKELGGADRYYWLLRLVAQDIVFLEHQTGRRFMEDRFTFDQVIAAINTILDHFKPPEASSPPERLTGLLDERAITLLGKRTALLTLSQLELAKMSDGDLRIWISSTPSPPVVIFPSGCKSLPLQNWSAIGGERNPQQESPQQNPGESPNDRSRSPPRHQVVGAEIRSQHGPAHRQAPYPLLHLQGHQARG
jgi:hypothetical protein